MGCRGRMEWSIWVLPLVSVEAASFDVVFLPLDGNRVFYLWCSLRNCILLVLLFFSLRAFLSLTLRPVSFSSRSQLRVEGGVSGLVCASTRAVSTTPAFERVSAPSGKQAHIKLQIQTYSSHIGCWHICTEKLTLEVSRRFEATNARRP